MNRRERIVARLTAALAPEHLEVEDESHMHAAGAGAETHYRVVVVGAVFSGKGLVERHRMVQAALAEEFAGGLHALSIQALDPDEFRARQGDLPPSPACRGGSKTA
ncbi:MAG: BolA family transcriptional regulator [Deltaproteobacteria bacterium]|nr:MAG: BolA family transcriptional regulator [Deltaproteobacteria bacterium]